MRVLGVDPGLTRCGLGVVDGRPGKAAMVAVGVVRTPSDGDPGERLVYLERELDTWLGRYEPDVVAVEPGFRDQDSLAAQRWRLGGRRGHRRTGSWNSPHRAFRRETISPTVA